MTHPISGIYSTVKQCSDVSALLRLEPTFPWKYQMKLIFHENTMESFYF